MTDDVVALTADYEHWLGGHIPLVAEDLKTKHEELAGEPVRFLRGTYYLWLHQMTAAFPELVNAPLVPLVGDLHVENFGTWLDAKGVRRWGVNDFDELSWGSYPIDLVRLATSAVLLPQLALTSKQVCDLILDHWSTAKRAAAVDLATDAARHLRPLVPKNPSAKSYFAHLRGSPPSDELPDTVRAAAIKSVDNKWQPDWFARSAGTGSLGHRRIVAVGPDPTGVEQAREVKELGPLTRDWPGTGASSGRADAVMFEPVLAALHGPHPYARIEGWQLRRLAPDVVRIDLGALRREDEQRLLRSMAQACANVHGVDATALDAARTHAATLGNDWLHDAVQQMTALTREAHKAWKAHATR